MFWNCMYLSLSLPLPARSNVQEETYNTSLAGVASVPCSARADHNHNLLYSMVREIRRFAKCYLMLLTKILLWFLCFKWRLAVGGIFIQSVFLLF